MPATTTSQSDPVAAGRVGTKGAVQSEREVSSIFAGICCGKRRVKKVSDTAPHINNGVAFQPKLSSDDEDCSTVADDTSSLSDSESIGSRSEEVAAAGAFRRYSIMTMLHVYEFSRPGTDKNSLATAPIGSTAPALAGMCLDHGDGVWKIPGRLTTAAFPSFLEPRRGVQCKKKDVVAEKVLGNRKTFAANALPPPRLKDSSELPCSKEKIARILKLLKEEKGDNGLPIEAVAEKPEGSRNEFPSLTAPGSNGSRERRLKKIEERSPKCFVGIIAGCADTAANVDKQELSAEFPKLSTELLRTTAPWRRQKAIAPPPVTDLAPVKGLQAPELLP